MKAAVIYEYGGPEVFRTEDIPEPEITEHEILIRVHAASVNPVDWKQRMGNHKLFLKAGFPIVPGYDVSGTVEKCGSGTSHFKPGDEVYSRLSRKFGGAFAELAAAPEEGTAIKPASIDHLHAAGLPMAGQTALQALRDKAGLSAGQSLLIIGAAGGVGHIAVQIGRIMGAETTAVCSSNHPQLLATIRPDHHIDYRKVDYLSAGNRYDVIFDVAGKASFLSCRRILNPGGVFISILPRPKILIHKIVALFSRGKKVKTFLQKPRRKDLELLSEWIDQGKLQVIIDSVFDLENMADAHRHAEEYSSGGKIVVKVL